MLLYNIRWAILGGANTVYICEENYDYIFEEMWESEKEATVFNF